jgi:hypothetical protein
MIFLVGEPLFCICEFCGSFFYKPGVLWFLWIFMDSLLSMLGWCLREVWLTYMVWHDDTRTNSWSCVGHLPPSGGHSESWWGFHRPQNYPVRLWVREPCICNQNETSIYDEFINLLTPTPPPIILKVIFKSISTTLLHKVRALWVDFSLQF